MVDLEKGELLVQHHFGLAECMDKRLKVGVTFEFTNRLDEQSKPDILLLLKICWCGPHLVIAHKREVANAKGELRLFFWENGNPGLLLTPAVIRTSNSFVHELTNVHIDLQEVILFMEDLENEQSFFSIHSQRC